MWILSPRALVLAGLALTFVGAGSRLLRNLERYQAATSDPFPTTPKTEPV